MRWLDFEANIPAWSTAALLQSSTYMAPPIHFLVFFQWFHKMITLHVSKIAELLWTAWVLVPIAYTLAIWDTKLFTCTCATWILAAGSIRERRLFCSPCLEVRWQFESSDLSRVASDWANTVGVFWSRSGMPEWTFTCRYLISNTLLKP